MKVLNVRNVREAYIQGLMLLSQEGVQQQSRAGDVLVLPYPLTTVYQNPCERVLIDSSRDANCFFHLAESLWMLGGRRDAMFLNKYIEDFAVRFAEANLNVHDAYGYRWRNHFQFDQLKTIIKKLRKNPDDRQAVLQMWDAANARDLTEKGYKTRPCLAGDTILWSPEGDLPISKVAKKFQRGEVTRWPVYSVKNTTMKIQWATNVWKSGRKQTSRITFDDGSFVECTDDHRFFKYNRTKIIETEVKNLKIGDRVQARERYWYRGYEMFGGPVHVQYVKLLHGNSKRLQVTHHKDENKKNNCAENLEYLTESKHNSFHRMGDRNPMRRLSSEAHKIRGQKHSVALKKYWASRTIAQRKAQTQEWRLGTVRRWNEYKQSQENHIIVDITPGPVQDVYDFIVPEFHTAVIGTGVVTHNCNTHAYFRVHNNRLDMTVCCRSNDAVWGAYGANVVHFSFLQEYMAAHIGVDMGVYYQISNNFHAYVDVMSKIQIGEVQPYETALVPLIADVKNFDDELKQFLLWVDIGKLEHTLIDKREWKNNFFPDVAIPLLHAHALYKNKLYASAGMAAQQIKSGDWQRAALEWLHRRHAKRQHKSYEAQRELRNA